MSLYKSSSLVMIPTAYKDGKLYSIRPTDGSGDFTFSRGSNLAATRVDVNGLIEKGRENLLLQSNQFDTTWLKTNSSVTSGQIGYDGSNDAWLFSSTAASGQIKQFLSPSGINTYSVYAKAGTLNWLRMLVVGSSVHARYFDLQNGVIGSSEYADEVTQTITSVGNGWYRCSMTTNATITEVRLFMSVSDLGHSSTTNGNIYIQDAQLEAGLVATDYIETGASTAQAGILEDMPRLDYSGSCPALLLEPQRSNLFTHSEYLKDWTDNNIIRTSNNSVSPEGVQNATLMSGDGTFGVHRFYQAPTFTTGTSYAISIFAKAGTNDFFQIYLGNAADGSSGQVYANFDLANGSKGTAGSNVDDYGIKNYGNGWYRCYLTFESQLTGTTGAFYNLTTSDSVGRAQSSTLSTNVEFYGAQIEAGSYPTSYIPTYGSSVTRSLDSCLATSVSDLIGQTEGTLFAEIDNEYTAGTSAERIIAVSDGSSSNRVIIIFSGSGFRFIVTSGGSTTCDTTIATSNTGKHKVAITYNSSGASFFVDGVKGGSDLSITLPSSLSAIYIGKNEGGAASNLYAGDVNQALVFKTALTDAECIALTTI